MILKSKRNSYNGLFEDVVSIKSTIMKISRDFGPGKGNGKLNQTRQTKVLILVHLGPQITVALTT